MAECHLMLHATGDKANKHAAPYPNSCPIRYLFPSNTCKIWYGDSCWNVSGAATVRWCWWRFCCAGEDEFPEPDETDTNNDGGSLHSEQTDRDEESAYDGEWHLLECCHKSHCINCKYQGFCKCCNIILAKDPRQLLYADYNSHWGKISLWLWRIIYSIIYSAYSCSMCCHDTVSMCQSFVMTCPGFLVLVGEHKSWMRCLKDWCNPATGSGTVWSHRREGFASLLFLSKWFMVLSSDNAAHSQCQFSLLFYLLLLSVEIQVLQSHSPYLIIAF